MPPTTAAAAGVFDASRAWIVNPRVAVRPEPFGALLYHFGTRRLSFLKDRKLLAVVQSLGDHADARSACVAQGVDEADLPQFTTALARLAGTGMLVPRDPEEPAA
jgi:putative mycofactocin binding protein MftB